MKIEKTNSKIYLAAIVLTGLIAISGCENSAARTGSTTDTNFAENSISEFHNLGWIGAASHPLMKPLSLTDPENSDSTVSPGGLVVREVYDDTPAAKAGLKAGDVIIGVEDDWLPINDDPTLDFIKMVESRVSALHPTTQLKIFRNGEYQSLSVENITSSLDDGLPDQVSRFDSSVASGLKYLASLQKNDGSFGKADSSLDSNAQTTAVAGLSFLAAGDEQFDSNIASCKAYLAAQLDALAKSEVSEEESAEKPPAKEGAIMMQVPSIEINPLTAAYVLQFLAESDVQMMDAKWMPRLMGLVGSLAKSQEPSGGWNTTETSDESAVDIEGVHTTNQVLLALGMLERKGVSGNADVIKNACGFLNQQIANLSSSSLDRRLKSSLTAGVGASLIAINCQVSDPVLQQAINDGLDQLSDRHLSPSLNLTGALSTAILARQTGSENWLKFHEGAKHWLCSVQRPDGSFQSIPREQAEALEFESALDNSASQTAHYCLMLAMQTGKLKRLTASAKAPMMVARNSQGEKTEGTSESQAAMPEGVPAGAKVITLDGLSGEGSLEDQIKEKLKEMGLPTDNIKIKGGPGGEPKKDEDEDPKKEDSGK